MMQDEFTDEEMGIIRETLEEYISGLEAEIRGADTLSFGTTQELFHKKAVVEKLIERIPRRVA
jgi:hypothetical protein